MFVCVCMHFCTAMKAKVVSLFNTRKGIHTFTRTTARHLCCFNFFVVTLSAEHIELRENAKTCGKSLKALHRNNFKPAKRVEA